MPDKATTRSSGRSPRTRRSRASSPAARRSPRYGRRALGARRAARARAGLRVLLPLQRQRGDQPDRPHEDGAARARPSALAFAFASCQQYEHGYFTAYKHMAQEDLDLVIHLGDYIYEYDSNSYTATGGNVRANSNHEIVNLADYRERHAQYKTDPDLQAAHAAFPWLVTFDDHEVDNNWAADIPEEGMPLDFFVRRRRAAFRAYWEHMPLRKADAPDGQRDPDLPPRAVRQPGDVPRDGHAPVPLRPGVRRRQPRRAATTATTRRARSPAPRRSSGSTTACRARRRSGRSSPSRSSWPSGTTPPARARRYNMDAWDGYKVSRDKLLDFIDTRKIANPIVITGDVHQNWAADLLRDFRDPASKILGSEFIGTSISTTGDGSDTANAARADREPLDQVQQPAARLRARRARPATPARPTTASLPYVKRPGAPISTQQVVRRRSRQPRPEGRMSMKTVLSPGGRRRRSSSPSTAPARSRTRRTAHVQLVEVEQQTPYLESFAGVTAGTATTSIIRRVSPARRPRARPTRSSTTTTATAAARSFPLDVEDADTYGLSAAFVKGPNFGIVQLFIDGRQLGAPFDLYAAALGVRAADRARHASRWLEGKHMLTMTVMGKNDGVDRLPRRASTCSSWTPPPRRSRRRPRSRRPRWARTVPATLALTLGARPRSAPFVPGVAQGVHGDDDGQRRVHGRRRGADGDRPRAAWPTARSRCAQPLRVELGRDAGAAPVSNDAVRDHVQAGDRRQRAAAHGHATRRR